MSTFLSTLVLYFLGFLLIYCPADLAVARPDSAQVESLVELQRMLFRDTFDQADSIAEALIRDYPDDPCGYLFASISLVSRSFDVEEEYRSDLFHSYLDSAECIVEREFQRSSCDSAWLYLCAGHIKAYRALWEGRFGSIITAVKQSRSARGDYIAGVEVDSTLYDLYFGLGLYHYWKSAKAGFLRKIGLIKDDKELGIAQLYLAYDLSIVSSESARSALIWIWLDQRQYDSVIVLAQQMYRQFPEGKAFLWAQGKAYMAMEQYDSAGAMFEMLNRYFAEHSGNFYNRVETDYFCAVCYEEMGDIDRLREVHIRVKSYVDSIPEETKRRQKKKLRFLTK